nr:uncharacterized protein LOC129163898 [Nothobranchius furzeri]XP_054599041.1 uncharacterized protein LOC129163898 [Nothobranchius furzeri]XP_054599042.1 uncharacterized protein LOC129163898 [Nothobranchius furzeri]
MDLGVIFDERLIWKENISNLVERCKNVINIMRCLRGNDWGASTKALKQVYIAMVRSVIDYGSIVYSSTSKTLLKKIEVIQSQALRICCGAMKTTPIVSSQVEMGEMPLTLRFKLLKLNYWTSVQGSTEDVHMVRGEMTVGGQCFNGQYESMVWKSCRLAEAFKLNDIVVLKKFLYSPTPFWLFPKVVIEFLIQNVIKIRKGVGNWANVVEERLNDAHQSFIPVYTDGSRKPGNLTGLSFWIPKFSKYHKSRTSNNLSVYTVEMLAISFSLQGIEQNGVRKSIICSDSMFVLMSIKEMSADKRSDILYEIFECLFRLMKTNSEVRFMWVPAHSGVEGNEIADYYAKQSTKLDTMMEVKSVIRQQILDEWQEQWIRDMKGRHLYKLKGKLGRMEIIHMSNRNQAVITRMRLGLTALNSTLFILGRHTRMCECGLDRETVEHVLCTCRKYVGNRKLLVNKLKVKGYREFELGILLNGGIVVYRLVIDFLRDSGLLDRI